MAFKITPAAADAALQAFADLVDDDTGQATVEIYSDDEGDPDVLLVAFDLAETPFGAPEAGPTVFRQIEATTGAEEDFDNLGESGAGAGTNAKHWIIKSEAGIIRAQGTVRGAGDPDNGEEAVMSNKNVAEGQQAVLESLVIRLRAEATE